MRSIRKAALAAALLPVAFFAAPAHATDVAHVVGTGTISPGLPTTGCSAQTSVKFTATAAIDTGDHTGTYAVSFSGSSGAGVCESLAAGSGGGTLSGGVSGTVTYSRSGSHVSINGSVTVGGDTANIIAGECYFNPTSANPVTSYALDCHVVLG